MVSTAFVVSLRVQPLTCRKAVFNCVSAYSNAGFSLLDESMIPFQQSYAFVASHQPFSRKNALT
jgi:Trk-type K+ transport system membrane component